MLVRLARPKVSPDCRETFQLADPDQLRAGIEDKSKTICAASASGS
jgi:hypothetical protein